MDWDRHWDDPESNLSAAAYAAVVQLAGGAGAENGTPGGWMRNKTKHQGDL